jgi:hypothetical protein
MTTWRSWGVLDLARDLARVWRPGSPEREGQPLSEPHSDYGNSFAADLLSLMDHNYNAILGLIGKVLQSRDSDIVHEELPKRWVDLIHHLDEQERKREQAKLKRPQ